METHWVHNRLKTLECVDSVGDEKGEGEKGMDEEWGNRGREGSRQRGIEGEYELILLRYLGNS